MDKYIKRLTKCGYTEGKARQVCMDFVRNLSLFDLECFIWAVENNVDKV